MITLRDRGPGSFDRPLILGIGVLLLLLAAGAVDALTTVIQWREAEVLEHTHEAREALHDFTSDLAQARAALRGRLLSGSPEELRTFADRLSRAHQALDAFERISENTEQRALTPPLRATFSALEQTWSESLRDLSARAEGAALSGRGSPSSNDLGLLQGAYAQVDQMQAAEQRLLDKRSKALQRAYIVALWSGILSTAVALGVVGLYILAVRRRARALAEAADRLEKLTDTLRVQDRRKDAFLATLAHELRSPLAPIRNVAAILARGAQNEQDAKRLAAMLERQARHMTALVNDLLDIARITRGKLVLGRERISLSTVLDTAIEASVPEIEARSQHLEVTRPNGAPEIDGDPVRLPQVLTNLLNNASRYTPRGGRIRMEVTLSGRDLQIAVKDNGIGIAPHAQGRIFEMFEQGETGAHGSQGGLGIGLALVKAVVELHGGWVALRSDGPGKGSEFFVRLPLIVLPSA